MPLISIIVPVYKVEKVLHNCIESILNQSFTDFELLLIDDGSPDKSGDICDSYAKKDSRIKVIHKHNQGVSTTRNKGFAMAQGKYIVCVDSDDYVDQDYLQSFLDVKEKYSDAEIIWCGIKTVSDYKKTVVDYAKFSNAEDISVSNVNKIMTLHKKWLNASPFNKLFSAEIIKENNLVMDKNLSLGEDLLFNLSYLDVCRNKKIYISNKCTYNYVKTGGESLDNKYYGNMFDVYKHINSMMYNYIIKWNVDENELDIYNVAVYYSYDKCLRNTFRKDSSLSEKERYKVNNDILHSKEFISAVKKAKNEIVFPLRIAYETKNYYIVEKVNNVIGKISKTRRGVKL